MDHGVRALSAPAPFNLRISRFAGKINAQVSGNFSICFEHISNAGGEIVPEGIFIWISLRSLDKTLLSLELPSLFDDLAAQLQIVSAGRL